jgi:23S rRNA pseudouridine2605 synthase
VQVDGQVVTTLGTKVDPDQAAILVDGRPIETRPPTLYLALHKPPGFDTTRSDPHAAHTVMELVLPGLEAKYGRGHPSVEGLHPVGRLDRESEGLLLLTNDGAFTHALTHPRHGVNKTYLAEVSGQPSPQALEQLRNGVVLEGRATAPAEARLASGAAGRGGSRVELTLREGRKRQVRLMLAAVGYPVRRLRRTAIGPVTLGGLKPGQYRELTAAEVIGLMTLPSSDDREKAASRRPRPAMRSSSADQARPPSRTPRQPRQEAKGPSPPRRKR